MIRNNTAVLYNGGGLICNLNSHAKIIKCTISANSAINGGGMYIFDKSNPIIKQCVISDNTAAGFGGGLVLSGSGPTIEDCLIEGNTAAAGAGIGIGDSTGAITDSIIRGNIADEIGGGLLCNNSSPEIINCIISGNTAIQYNGGGLYNYSNGNPTLINCTFYNNSAGYGGGIYSGEHSYPTLSNSILWNDVPDAITEDDTSTITASYSNIDGGWLGVGNIDAEPLFFTDIDYHLSAGSPCIDAGDNIAVPPDATDLDDDGDTAEPIPFDLDGNPRFVDDPESDDCPQAPETCGDAPVVDMGCYELQLCPADFDDDGTVGASDLAELLGSWGPYEPCPPFDEADFNEDCGVNAFDLAELLGDWGPCK
jgi:hypothetical protein